MAPVSAIRTLSWIRRPGSSADRSARSHVAPMRSVWHPASATAHPATGERRTWDANRFVLRTADLASAWRPTSASASPGSLNGPIGMYAKLSATCKSIDISRL